MKLKLKTNPQAADGAPAESSTNGASQPTAVSAPSAGPKLALKFKPAAPPPRDSTEGPAGDAPKPKRKYTKKPKVDENGQPLPGTKAGPKPKKRGLEDAEERGPAKRKIKPTMKSLSADYVEESDDEQDTAPAPAVQQAARQGSIKITLGKKSSGAKPTAVLKVKGPGKAPPRPPGVGYDSEAEEAEDDPAIESQFVLRMAPGPDNDLIRKSIEEKTIGKSMSNGGPGVQFRFFDREGRKAMVTVQNRYYAATMVELPCVIESLKSWNKKDWVKTADVCQMLLVLGRVQNEEEARKFARPREVEPESHRYPHGLTPPMRWVRKRRFRPRKSYLDVERIENTVEQLLAADEGAEDSKYDLIDSDAESSSGDDSEADAAGEDEEMAEADYAETPMAEVADPDDIMAALHQEFEDDDIEVEANGDVNMADLFGDNNEIEVETPATTGAHEVAMHALGQNGNIVVETGSAASTPAAATSPDDDDEDDDDDEEDDPEEAEKQRELEQKQAEIRELDAMIESNKATLATATNVLYKKRLVAQIEQLTKDKHVKMSQIGMTDDD